MTQEIQTYRDLLNCLSKMTDGQLDQPVQVVEPTVVCEDITELKPAISIGTVKDLGFDTARSTVDNRYHEDEIVLLMDGNPFGEDGAIAYEVDLDEKDWLSNGKPIYGKNGKTSRNEQMADETCKDEDPAHLIHSLNYRKQKGKI